MTKYIVETSDGTCELDADYLRAEPGGALGFYQHAEVVLLLAARSWELVSSAELQWTRTPSPPPPQPAQPTRIIPAFP
jgi:hypothetical protein